MRKPRQKNVVTISGFLNVTECDTWQWAMRAGPGHVNEVPRGYLQLWPGRSWNRQKEIPVSHHGKWHRHKRLIQTSERLSRCLRDLWGMWSVMRPHQPPVSVAAVSYVDDSFPLRARTGELLAPCHHRGSLTARREKDARDARLFWLVSGVAGCFIRWVATDQRK